jgi:hypothetical protein
MTRIITKHHVMARLAPRMRPTSCTRLTRRVSLIFLFLVTFWSLLFLWRSSQLHTEIKSADDAILRVSKYESRASHAVRAAAVYTRNIVNRIDYKCKLQRVFGSELGENGTLPICWDKWRSLANPYGPKCIVYSFSPPYKYEYALEVYDMTDCSIYTFDAKQLGWPTHKRYGQPHTMFVPEAVGDAAGLTLTADNGAVLNWKTNTFSGFRKRFNHKEINFVRVDTFFAEYKAFEVALRDGFFNHVHQLSLGVDFWKRHEKPDAETMNGWNRVIDGLRNVGFKLFYKAANRTAPVFDLGLGFPVPCCYQLVFIKD